MSSLKTGAMDDDLIPTNHEALGRGISRSYRDVKPAHCTFKYISYGLSKYLKLEHEIATIDGGTGISRSYRDVKPAHCTFKIVSFSDLLKANTEKYQSDIFKASGFNWRVSVYPRGRNEGDEDHQVSMYLEIVNTQKLIHNWEVYVNYKLFVYDHLMDRYYTIQDVDGRVRRFHSLKTEWGFDKFLSLETLTNASNGYINDDTCVFGAEVFVIKESSKTIVETNANTYTWKIDDFSTLKNEKYHSKIFVVGGHTWNLLLYPEGDGVGKNVDKSILLYLAADWVDQKPEQSLYAKFKLRIKNQLNSNVVEKACGSWFCASRNAWGYDTFISPEDLKDASKGYLLNDTIVLEVEITEMSLLKK